MSLACRSVVVDNRLGLHARAAARFVEVAGRFRSSIKVRANGITVDGKSILGLMAMAAGRGSTLELIADGADALEALEALLELVAHGFGESG